MLWKPVLTFLSPASASFGSAVIFISTWLAIALWLSLLDYRTMRRIVTSSAIN